MINHLDPIFSWCRSFPVIILTLGLLTAIQKESGRYERFPKLLEENHCVETIKSLKMKFQILPES